MVSRGGLLASFAFGAFVFMESEPVLSLVDALFLCIAFLPDLPITSIFSARFEAGSKLARTCVPSRIEERSLELDPLLSTIWVLSSTVRVMRSPWRELMTRLLPSGSTFDTRPTADFRFAMLPADEPRSIDPREPEVPVEVSLWAVLLWPDVEPVLPSEPLLVLEPAPLWPEVDPLMPPGLVLELLEPVFGLFWPDVDPLEPVPLCPYVEPLEPVPLWPYVEPLEPVPPWPYVEPLVLPGLVLELLELALGLVWSEVDDDVFAWPLRSLPIDEVPVDEPVFAVAPPEVEPLADPCVPLVEPCVATWPWLPAALWVPSTEPCVLVPVVEVFEAVRVSFCDPEHAAISAAAPSAVTK